MFQVITDSSSSCASVRTYLSVGLFFFVSVASHLRVFADLFFQLPSAASSAEWCRADNLRPASNNKSPDRVVTSYRPGGRRRNDMPPRRWQFDTRRIYARFRTGPQSAHLWWPASQWRRHGMDGMDWGGHVHPTFARGRLAPETDTNPTSFYRGEGRGSVRLRFGLQTPRSSCLSTPHILTWRRPCGQLQAASVPIA